MKNGHACRQAGFTLIETLVYLALYSIISLAMLAAVYSVLESGARNETTAMVEEEGDFLIAKIDAVISGAISIQLPVSSGTTLALTESSGSNIVIKNDVRGIRLQEGDTAFETLNNSNVSVADLTFVRVQAVNDRLTLENISAFFTLYATTSDGQVLSRDFSTSIYLHL